MTLTSSANIYCVLVEKVYGGGEKYSGSPNGYDIIHSHRKKGRKNVLRGTAYQAFQAAGVRPPSSARQPFSIYNRIVYRAGRWIA